MTKSKSLLWLLTGLPLLCSCQTVAQPNGSYVLTAAPSNPAPNGQTAKPPLSDFHANPPAQTVQRIIVYKGPLGGGQGTITLAHGTGGASPFYDGKAEMFSKGPAMCGGTLEGVVHEVGNTLTLYKKTPGQPDCTLTMTRKGGSLSVTENECSAWHGASCEFSGTVTQVK